MNFQFYKEKLEDSEKYKSFKKNNPNAYLCSCLFILDRENEGKDNKIHFDFWEPKEKKMSSFRVDGEVEFMDVENFETKPFEEVSIERPFDLEDFEKLIKEKMEEEKIKGEIKKLLFSLQKLKGKNFLIVTGFLNNLGLLKVNISIDENKIISIEKKSFLDMMKIVKGNRNKNLEKKEKKN